MSKSRVQQLASALLICSVATFAADTRDLGTWRLRSASVVEGSSATPHFAVNSIMTIKQGSAGGVAIRIEPKQPEVTDQSPVMRHTDFSADGKTMTETNFKANPRYRVVYIWDKQ